MHGGFRVRTHATRVSAKSSEGYLIVCLKTLSELLSAFQDLKLTLNLRIRQQYIDAIQIRHQSSGYNNHVLGCCP